MQLKRIGKNEKWFPKFDSETGETNGTYLEVHCDTKNVLAYVLKGLAPDSELATLLIDNSLTAKRGNWKPTYQGSIEGLRCRVSDNVGWQARTRHDGEVIPLPDLEGLHPLPAILAFPPSQDRWQ